MARNGALLPSITPAAWAVSGPQSFIAQELRKIYPLPNKVTTRPTTSLGEVRQPRFPSVLLEIGYHDNYSDATWLEGHWDAIAQQIARGLTEYFGLPFIYAHGPDAGHRVCEQRHAEPAGLSILLRQGDRQPSQRRHCYDLRRMERLVCGALRGSGGVCCRGIHQYVRIRGFPPRREAGGPETGVHLTDLVKNSKSVRRNLGKYTDLP